jgi:hypothetical protein
MCESYLRDQREPLTDIDRSLPHLRHGAPRTRLLHRIRIRHGWGLLGCLLLAPQLTADVPFRTPPVDISAGGVRGVTAIKIGDLNKDGLPDIAVFEGGKHASGRQTFAWFEAPDWTRREFNTAYRPGPFLGDAALADVNQDGYLDVILPQDPHSGSGTGYLFWYENPRNGSTSSWPRRLIGSWADAIHIGEVEVADMDSDGLLDVVIRHLGDDSVRICFQNSPTSWTTRKLPVRFREGLTLGDLDRDGRTDIILNGFWWAAPASPRTQAYTEYIIDPAFYTQPVSGLNNSTKSALGDIDGDGINDLVIVPAEGEKEYLAWYKGPQSPRTQPWTRRIIQSDWGNMHQVELGDIDRDGDLDIAGGLSFGDEGIFVWFNQGGGTSWQRQTVILTEGLYHGVLGDIGADGDLDIVGPTTYSSYSKPFLYENLLLDGSAPADPVLTILAPSDGTIIAVGTPVAFTATATDPIDGDLSYAITWKSSMDGTLGTGSTVAVADLSPGAHLISASVTDSHGLSTTDALNLTVAPVDSETPLSERLILFLDAREGVTQSAGQVTSWADRSARGNHLVAKGGPTLANGFAPSGAPAVRLDGVNDTLERIHASSPLNGFPAGNADRTIFLVGRYLDSTWWSGVAYGNPTRNEAFGLNVKHPSGELVLHGWATDLISTTPGIGAGWMIQSAVLSSAKATLYKNGAQIAQWTHSYNTVLNKLAIGQDLGGKGFVKLDVAAVLVYDRALSADERGSVEGFLSSTYLGSVSPEPAPNTPPALNVLSPSDGAVVAAGAPVSFTASASDTQDGNLGAAIAWSSSMDGPLGSGASITKTDLSTGTHIITATVTDKGGLTASETVQLTVTAGAPSLPVTAGLVLHLEASNGVTTSSGVVTGWSDQSGRGNHLVARNGPKWVNGAAPSGAAVVSLDGVNDTLERIHASSPLNGFPSGNADRTIVLVGRYIDSTWWSGVAYGNAYRNQAFGLNVKHPSGELVLHGWATDLISTTPGIGAGWMIQSAVLGSGTATLFKNGAQIAQWKNTYNTVLKKLAIGQDLGAKGHVKLEVAAVLIYDRALTANERATLESYLSSAYLQPGGSGALARATTPFVGSVQPNLALRVERLDTGALRLHLPELLEGGSYSLHALTNLARQNLADPATVLHTFSEEEIRRMPPITRSAQTVELAPEGNAVFFQLQFNGDRASDVR